MTSEDKQNLIKVIQSEAVSLNCEQDALLIKLLEDDLADGGCRFEQLYYASNSFYG